MLEFQDITYIYWPKDPTSVLFFAGKSILNFKGVFFHNFYSFCFLTSVLLAWAKYPLQSPKVAVSRY